MANVKHLLQGLKPYDDHLSAIEHLLKIKDIKKIFFSVAFLRERGIVLIEKLIRTHKNKLEMIIGIRNGVTSAQALERLIKNKIFPFVVDTATTTTVFHPKIFLSYSNRIARIVIGSANLTVGGLVRNIEASSLIELNLSDKIDKEYLDNILRTFKNLEMSYPNNIFKVSSLKQVKALLEEGRLVNEYKIVHPVIAGKSSKGKLDDIAKINLKTRKIKTTPVRPTFPRSKKKRKSTRKIISQDSSWVLLWESRPLTERDLNVPSGRTTNPTGSMLLKKGNVQGIDQRNYFREVIFNNLDWTFDNTPGKSHLERSYATFQIIIKGISYGVFKLRLSHNTRIDSRAYKQHNAMSQLHWGKAKEIIAKRELLGCILKLYKPSKANDSFIIDIE